MKKLFSRIKANPPKRGWRIAAALLLTAVLLFFTCTMAGWPALSPEHALRRAERRALIGMEGDVVFETGGMRYNMNATCTLAVRYGNRAAALFGVSQDGPLKLGWDRNSTGSAYYVFPQDQRGITVAAFTGYPRYMGFPEEAMFIGLFHDMEGADSAELSFTLTGEPFGTDFLCDYTLSSVDAGDGFFLFAFSSAATDEDFVESPDYHPIRDLAGRIDPWTYSQRGDDIAARVRFFDAAGNEIGGGETVFARALLQGG
ncbi:MAG: hypothetical protein IJO10_07265 [Clostridia bacterium]|nr:hypothetical protein [Clostridia bacterium]